ncbi:MAG: hypothetical protein HUJ25_05410 [Crocinitomicaceae bacterium]|nr:hypothetical protein [Crocinitomicaceae bacterium]
MTRALLIFITGITFLACARNLKETDSQAKYTFSVKGWESLGTQTLVILDATNPSAMDQQITFTVNVINTDGQKFSKDTTIKFARDESQKNFQLIVDTEGEIEDVIVSAI